MTKINYNSKDKKTIRSVLNIFTIYREISKETVVILDSLNYIKGEFFAFSWNLIHYFL